MAGSVRWNQTLDHHLDHLQLVGAMINMPLNVTLCTRFLVLATAGPLVSGETFVILSRPARLGRCWRLAHMITV
jgi:hypothetical protein